MTQERRATVTSPIAATSIFITGVLCQFYLSLEHDENAASIFTNVLCGTPILQISEIGNFG